MTKDQILTEAMALDPTERDEIAQSLWQCAEPGELTPLQLAEIHKRIAALDRGETQAIPGEQVMLELRRHLER